MALFSFLKSRGDAPPPPDASLGAAPAQGDERALETLASVVRTFGAAAPTIDEPTPADAARLGNGWSDHLLLGRPPPDVPEAPPGRDFGSLRRAVSLWRKREVQAVDAALGSLRTAVWALIGGFNAALGEEAHEDGVVREQLQRLRLAAAEDDLLSLRNQVLDASETIAASIVQRRRAQQERAAELGAKIRSLNSALQEARRESLTDGLTRLANRRALDEHLLHATELAQLVAPRVVLVLVDIDHFKQVNDRHGHPAGDAVLRAVADTLTRTFIRRGDFLARYGGEELVAVLSDTGLTDARAPIHRLLDAVRALEVPHGGRTLRVTVSAGAAELAAGESPAAWISRADAAMYAAKAGGRDQARFAPPPEG